MHKYACVWINWIQYRWLVTYNTFICDYWFNVQYYWKYYFTNTKIEVIYAANEQKNNKIHIDF